MRSVIEYRPEIDTLRAISVFAVIIYHAGVHNNLFFPGGYLGVDIVLDRCHGPLLLELNARPGLAIQMANQAGLEPRLKWVVEQEKKTGKKADVSAEQKVSMAMAVFN